MNEFDVDYESLPPVNVSASPVTTSEEPSKNPLFISTDSILAETIGAFGDAADLAELHGKPETLLTAVTMGEVVEAAISGFDSSDELLESIMPSDDAVVEPSTELIQQMAEQTASQIAASNVDVVENLELSNASEDSLAPALAEVSSELSVAVTAGIDVENKAPDDVAELQNTFVEYEAAREELAPTEPARAKVESAAAEVFPFELCDETLLQDIAAIPDRLAFKIGDVADLVHVKPYVLRYWETEFDVLHPRKSKNNQRMYSKRDVENVLLIKKLLYRDRFSIEGARAALKQLKTQVKKERKTIEIHSRHRESISKLNELVNDIRSFRALITRLQEFSSK
jgi:DNA-binding transcriptional MerR regulator